MNQRRYLIEYWYGNYEEDSNDSFYLCRATNILREIFEDESEFNNRLSELQYLYNDFIYDGVKYEGCEIYGIYTCDLTPVTSR